MNTQSDNRPAQSQGDLNGNVPQGKGLARKLLPFLPLLVFAALAAIFFTRIGSDNQAIPSVLVGKPAPNTDLPPLSGEAEKTNLTSADFIGKTTVVNVWASWCVPCRAEHEFISELARDERIQVFGINYKDGEENAKSFLNQLGNPFAKIGVDSRGKQSIDWGVYGVPETFIINKNGIITYKHIGPLGRKSLKDSFLPELEKAIHSEQKK